MARVSKAAKAAKAAQTVSVQGVAAGSANITVAAKTDPTKKATVKITVVDGSVSTSSVADLVVEGTKEITATVDGLGEGYTVEWFVEPDTGDDGYVTVAKDGTDQLKATITGVKEGGGRVGAKATYKGLEFSDSSRVSCGPKPEPDKPTSVYISETASGSPSITEVSVELGKVHTLSVHVLPATAPQGWRISDSGDSAIAAIQTSGAFLEIDTMQSGSVGETSCTVASTTDDSITATLKVTVTPASA